MKKNQGNKPSLWKGRGPKQKLLFCPVHQILYPGWSEHNCDGIPVAKSTHLKGQKKGRKSTK